jgi:hypothetical protein
MPNADRDNSIETPRRGYHRWFLATLTSLAICTLIAFFVLDLHYRIRIGAVAATATLLLLYQWVQLYVRSVNEKDDWLDAARRHNDHADDERPELYYVEVGETRTPNGTASKRFHLGDSKSRAELLAAVVTGIWNRHNREWTPKALDEVAAAFRTGDEELTLIAKERGAGPTTEVRIQVSKP